MLAEFTQVNLKIIGKGGHGAVPELAINPITTGCKVYQKYLELVDVFTKAGHNFSTTLPVFHSGIASNAIADTCII